MPKFFHLEDDDGLHRIRGCFISRNVACTVQKRLNWCKSLVRCFYSWILDIILLSFSQSDAFDRNQISTLLNRVQVITVRTTFLKLLDPVFSVWKKIILYKKYIIFWGEQSIMCYFRLYNRLLSLNDWLFAFTWFLIYYFQS